MSVGREYEIILQPGPEGVFVSVPELPPLKRRAGTSNEAVAVTMSSGIKHPDAIPVLLR
jgi:hypothetical protein